MDELLLDNEWSFLDVEQRIAAPWIMIDRNEQGWINPVRSLPYIMEKEFIKYKAINGAEVNNKTGEINFFMTPWTHDRPIYEKLFTLFDLQEMLEKNITNAIFSLDPVDPDKPYHPFNLMRFLPSQLCDSELLNTMLLTDYILKFLTTNQEVQGQYPFDQRSVATMIEHLPEYLRNIINRYHGDANSGALHRFWIEAEEIDIFHSDKEITNDSVRITLGNMKMVVKKHEMERDIHGNLQDVSTENEGWSIYLFTMEEMIELEMGLRVIDSNAMIFIYNESLLYIWEHKKVIHTNYLEKNFRETLNRLFRQPKDEAGKVVQNTKNMPLIYRATKEMARQAGLSHRYSPEFIFAHEFTTHYDEFALYLPEFGRLKELSKISSLIQILNDMRKSNRERNLESGFAQINLGKHEELIDLKGKCFWVPASTRHEVHKEATTGLSCYSFFVYGGVNLQPRINYAMGNNGPLGGSAVGGSSFNRADITRGYQSHHIISPTNDATKNHPLLKLAGFTNIDSRPNRIYLPTQESQHPSRSIHSGRHSQPAMDEVGMKMDRIVLQGKSENWSQSQFRAGLRDMLASERQHLRAGNIALNSKHRPWSNPKY